jgi:hypothetical protein
MMHSVQKKCMWQRTDEPALSSRVSFNDLAQDANSNVKLVSVKKKIGRDNGRLSEVIRCPLYPQKRTSAECSRMSALCQKQTYQRYSITLSARTITDDGMVIPSVLALFKLTTSSNIVGRSIGSSVGVLPLRMRSTK